MKNNNCNDCQLKNFVEDIERERTLLRALSQKQQKQIEILKKSRNK